MTYYITVFTCAVLKQILHMLRYCCTKSNKLSPSLIIESLAAAKSAGCLQQSLQAVYSNHCRLFTAITAGCLQQSLQAVYSNHCRVFTLVRMWLVTCTCSIYMYSIQLEYFSQHDMALACHMEQGQCCGCLCQLADAGAVWGVCKFHYINLCR